MRNIHSGRPAHRPRVRRPMPRSLAADLIHSLDLSAEDRATVLTLSAPWAGVNDVLAAAAGPRMPLGELLVRAGRLTPLQLDTALADQRVSGRRLGEVLIRNGLLNAAELRAILAFQQRLAGRGCANAGPMQLGNLLVAIGRISPAQLDFVLERQRISKCRLGEALVDAGLATETQIAHGLRLQQVMLGVAVAVLLALSIPRAAAAPGAAYGAIALSATVLPYHRVEVVRQVATLNVTPADIARGYVDVPAATSLRAQTNARQGFRINFDPRSDWFDHATISGIGGSVDIGPGGGAAHHAYAGRDTSLELSYRFYIAPGFAPGSYPWPLQISSSVVY